MKIEDVQMPAEPVLNSEAAAMPKMRRPDHPKVTCVLPAFNEAKNLPRVVSMLDETLRPICSEYSVLIVDDGSSDDTAAAAIALANRYPVKLL